MVEDCSYLRLLEAVSSHYENAREALVRAYWCIGRDIVENIQRNNARAEYGTKLMQRLSADLSERFGGGFSRPTIARIRRFYLLYPKSSTLRELTWSQYVQLLKVEDSSVRAELEERIESEGLSARQTAELVSRTAPGESYQVKASAKSRAKLRYSRGQLYFYKIYSDASEGRCFVDCGFKILRKVPCASTMKAGQLVRSVSEGNDFLLISDESDRHALYTYPARLDRVVDGDTLKLVIDVGFGIRIVEKVRLKGIDTPELSTNAGKKVKFAVQELLAKSPMLVVKTYGYGKYARVMADVFFLEGETDPQVVSEKGTLLNQYLLNEGMAEKYF